MGVEVAAAEWSTGALDVVLVVPLLEVVEEEVLGDSVIEVDGEGMVVDVAFRLLFFFGMIVGKS